MKLKPIQSGVSLSADNAVNLRLPQFDVEGATAICLNMRHSSDDTLEALRRQTPVATMQRTVVATDRRVCGTNILSVWDNDGALYLYIEGIFHPDGEYESLESMICALPAAVAECSSVGEFLVLRLADRRLFFLLWESDTLEYSSLGLLPSLPEVTFRREELSDVVVTISAMEFKSVVTDLRSGVPDAVTEQVSDAVVAAWTAGVEQAHALGAFVEPVVARIGLRLWDGSLYYLSEVETIPGMTYVGADAIELGLRKSSDGYTGTGTGSLTIPKYRLSVRVERGVESDWGSVVRGIELYISTEQEVLSSSSAAVYYASASDTLHCTLPMRSSALLERALADQPMLRVADYDPLSAGEYSVEWRSGTASLLTAITPPQGTAEHICGHGGFLHLLGDKTLTTLLRGNPFVVADATVLGEDATAMVAQPSGGGAYTRQYLYLFAETGVYALTHDFTGKHVNCRLISPLTVASDASLAVADDGVWMVSRDGGVVALLKDSKVQPRLRGMTMVDTLAWHRDFGELWILSDSWQVALVIQEDGQAYMRKIAPQQWVSRHGELIYIRQELDKTAVDKYAEKLYRLSADAPLSGADSDTILVLLRDYPLSAEGNAILRLDIYGKEVDADLAITITAPLLPGYSRTLKGSIAGNILFERVMPLRTPRISAIRQASLHADISLSGKIPVYKNIRLENVGR